MDFKPNTSVDDMDLKTAQDYLAWLNGNINNAEQNDAWRKKVREKIPIVEAHIKSLGGEVAQQPTAKESNVHTAPDRRTTDDKIGYANEVDANKRQQRQEAAQRAQEDADRENDPMNTGGMGGGGFVTPPVQSSGVDPGKPGQNATLVDSAYNAMLGQVYDQGPRSEYTRRNQNANAMSDPETLRLSRLADAINNRYYRNPYQFGTGVALYGGGTSGDVTGHIGEQYRMPIETEEMRQQERARQYEALGRGRQIGREEDFYDLRLQQDRDRMAEYLRNTAGWSDAQIQTYMQRYGQNLTYEQMAYQERIRQVATYYNEVAIPQTVANIAGNLHTREDIRNIFAIRAGVPVGVPSQLVSLWNQQGLNVYNQQERLHGSSKEAQEAVLTATIEAVARYAAQTIHITSESAKIELERMLRGSIVNQAGRH